MEIILVMYNYFLLYTEFILTFFRNKPAIISIQTFSFFSTSFRSYAYL